MSNRDISWDDIRVFLAYLRKGTVANAAAELKISPPTISRRMSALQEALGFPLLIRSPRGLELSERAEPLVQIWQEAERMLENAPALVSRMQGQQNIELRFSTTPALATAVIFPNLSTYIERWPNVMIDVDTSYRVVDIGAGQGDMALRFVEPERGAVIRQRVGTLSFGVYCSERIIPDGLEPVSDWHGLSRTGIRAVTWSPGTSVSMPQQKLREVLDAGRAGISITEYSGLVDAIRNGLGAGVLPDIVGRRLPGTRPITVPGLVGRMPLWLVTADRLAGYRHISDFRDFVRDAIQKETAAITTE